MLDRAIVLVTLLSMSFCIGQYTPLFRNYSSAELGAGNKNWEVSVAETGEVYIANDKGLLAFDGVKWDFYQLPNKTIIRSVFAHKDSIFTGSYEEFGYWKKNSKGRLAYTSLSNINETKKSLAEEFWQIIHHKGAILFRSFSSLYIFNNGAVKRVVPPSTISSCAVVDNQIYLSTIRHGIFVLKNGTLIPEIIDPKLIDTRVVSITKYREKFLITTALKGGYVYDLSKRVLTAWKAEINSTLKAQQLNCFRQLKSGEMIFGTIKNGVYITDTSGNIKYHLNKENGLLNNTVLSLELDDYNQLWLGLDNGMSRVNLNYSHVLFNDYSGKLGAVYDVAFYNDRLYLGSNTGLFYIAFRIYRIKRTIPDGLS